MYTWFQFGVGPPQGNFGLFYHELSLTVLKSVTVVANFEKFKISPDFLLNLKKSHLISKS